MLSQLVSIGSPGLSYTSVMVALTLLALVVGLIDVLCRDDTGVRLCPRWVWFLVVVVVPILGTLVWLVFGRPRARSVRRRSRRRGMPRPSSSVVATFPEYDRPGRYVPQDPAADAEFLRQIRERAQEQRRVPELERSRRDDTGGSVL